MNREMWIKKALEEGFESFEIYQDVEEEKKYTWYKGRAGEAAVRVPANNS